MGEQFRKRNEKRRAIENIGGEEDTIPHKRQRIVNNESTKVKKGEVFQPIVEKGGPTSKTE